MVNWVLRGAVLLWALLFFIVGIRGVLNPASFTETFGIIADGVAANTVRADMSAFFCCALRHRAGRPPDRGRER